MLMKRECVSPLGPAVLTTGIPKRKRLRASYLAGKLRLRDILTFVESLLKSHGSRRKLRELAGKIEGALTEPERASEEYESFFELEGLQEHLELTEKAIEIANLCLENIEILINERESEPSSEAGIIYAPSLQFKSTSGDSSPSRASENERRVRVMDIQVEQAKREAQHRQEEERKRAEILEQEDN